jgi:aminoglycoside/choline kinase family phosphotransferase
LLNRHSGIFDDAMRGSVLVHGDLGGRNILVASDPEGDWFISGLIDWENAFQGSTLWDIGSLFRYSRRYSEDFRKRFEQGYSDAGRVLRTDWWVAGRLLDSIRVVGILNEERELPIIFKECRELIVGLVGEVE